MIVNKIINTNFKFNKINSGRENINIIKSDNSLKELSNICYKPISFGSRETAESIIRKIGEKNFPAKNIVTLFRNNGQNSDDLRRIHKDYYDNLKYCSNMEEARLIYPEFSSVIDASELTIDDLSALKFQNDDSYTNSNTKIKDLSLTLLTNYYANLYDVNKDRDKFFGYTVPSTVRLMSKLNIPFMDKNYYQFVSKNSEK